MKITRDNLTTFIILGTIVLIMLIFAVLKFSRVMDVPDFVFLIFGIAALIAPLSFHLVQKSTMKMNEQGQQSRNTFSRWLFVAGMCIIFVITFFAARDMFLPLLLCELPFFIYLMYVERKYHTGQKDNPNSIQQ